MSETFSLGNPVLVTYLIASALMVLKVMGQGWITVHFMLHHNAGLASPEDLRPGLINPDPRPDQLAPNDDVERSRRMHRNDLENIPAFWAAGFGLVMVEPPLLLAQIALYGFVAARVAHAVAYSRAMSHEVRATFYTIGSLIVIGMAAFALWKLIIG